MGHLCFHDKQLFQALAWASDASASKKLCLFTLNTPLTTTVYALDFASCVWLLSVLLTAPSLPSSLLCFSMSLMRSTHCGILRPSRHEIFNLTTSYTLCHQPSTVSSSSSPCRAWNLQSCNREVVIWSNICSTPGAYILKQSPQCLPNTHVVYLILCLHVWWQRSRFVYFLVREKNSLV